MGVLTSQRVYFELATGLVSVRVVMNLLVQTQTHNNLDTQGLGLSSGLGLRMQTEYQTRRYSIQQKRLQHGG